MVDIKVVYKPIDDIIPYENNPRKNDKAVDVVANSIKMFGFRNPIIIDKDNVIVAGHTRLKAAKKLGINRVPTVSADDLTPDEVKAFRLADNKVAEAAEWDFEILTAELGILETQFDMTDYGFSDYNPQDYFDDGESIGVQTADVDDYESKSKVIECPHCGFKFEV
jgi:site-specific DNA-methyltransferase (adenine-specific)